MAYKYKLARDKEVLKSNLEEISNLLLSLGHQPFLLGRDIQRWGLCSTPLWKTIPIIVKNLTKADCIFAYIDEEGKSDGLSFEILLSKILNKKIYMAIREDLKVKRLREQSHKTLEFKDIEDLKTKLQEFIL